MLLMEIPTLEIKLELLINRKNMLAGEACHPLSGRAVRDPYRHVALYNYSLL